MDDTLPADEQQRSDRLEGRPLADRATQPLGTERGIPPLSQSEPPQPAALKISPEDAEAIKQKAFEIPRKEYPPPPAPILPLPLSPVPPSAAPEATATLHTAHSATCPAEVQNEGGLRTQVIPARMLNEFVYCQRLFYYEFVEGVFVESADTLRGGAIHQRVDSGTGALPKAKRKAETGKSKPEEGIVTPAESTDKEPQIKSVEPETIHSRSVQMGSERLGVLAKMDLVETKAEKEDLFTALEVCPVDYKAGAPKEGEEANALWDTDKMQLGLQDLILRCNRYICNEGVIYYRATKQRVRLPITPELESWILQNIAEARRVVTGPIPAPLVHSPKCVRCSLAPVCLPDETRMLSRESVERVVLVQPSDAPTLSRSDAPTLAHSDTPALRHPGTAPG